MGFYGRTVFSPFPPSFYYTHTDEEIECIINELREFILNYDDEDEKRHKNIFQNFIRYFYK